MHINVKDSPYRAAGNGTADDTQAIQMALRAAAQAGGTVYLPAGTYSVSRPLSWTAPDVHLVGEGGTRIAPAAAFAGEAVVLVGQATASLNPTYRASIRDVAVDLGVCAQPNLIGVELKQTWFAHVDNLKILSPNGMAQPTQTAFQIHGGALPNSVAMTNWAANNNVFDLQVNGSFLYSIRHVAGGPGGTVNGTNYFGGFAYCTAASKAGSFGFRIDPGAGDSTRVYGVALEDYDTGVYVGSQNNGPLDFRVEGCNTPYAASPGVTFAVPAFAAKP